jgi:osmotically inducible protein OsmC
MALSHILEQQGHTAESIDTTADVEIAQAGQGFKITTIHLTTEARVPGISENEFQAHADTAKETCPVSRALAGVSITLEAKLLEPANT